MQALELVRRASWHRKPIVFTARWGAAAGYSGPGAADETGRFYLADALPGSASAAEIAAAMRDAEYLTGFVRFLPDEAYTQATRLEAGPGAQRWL